MMDLSEYKDFKSGFVAIVGAPNVGKSTLLDRMLGQKISITSKKPQTTRNRILGVLDRPGAQLVFLDTPGVHRASKALNVRIVDVALSALAEGADTLFAEAALELGVPLEAVTPFKRYIEDFEGQAQEHYQRLLAQAQVEHRLPHAERSDEAYLAGGLWVVDHCNLLVVVWNGQPAAGKGGTGDVVDYARQVVRPYIHIHTVERTVTYSPASN